MTFTYAFDAALDRDQIRYHLSDTQEETAVFSDEDIQMALTMAGSVSAAVIALIKQRLQKLANEPDSKIDFLSVDWKRSQKAWETMLAEKRKEFGIPSRSGSAVHTYRADSLQSEAPDYEAMNEGVDEEE